MNGKKWYGLVLLSMALTAVIVVSSLIGDGGSSAASPSGSGQGAGELIGVRLRGADPKLIARWGIIPLRTEEDGALVAHVTQEQWERLRAAAVDMETLGRVATFSSENPSALGYCYGRNDTNYPITSYGTWYKSYIDLSGCSVWSGAQITSVAYYIVFETNRVATDQCPGCYGQLNIWLNYSNYTKQLQLNAVNETKCCPVGSPPKLDEQTESYGCVVSGSTSHFNGICRTGVGMLMSRLPANITRPTRWITGRYTSTITTPR